MEWTCWTPDKNVQLPGSITGKHKATRLSTDIRQLCSYGGKKEHKIGSWCFSTSKRHIFRSRVQILVSYYSSEMPTFFCCMTRMDSLDPPDFPQKNLMLNKLHKIEFSVTKCIKLLKIMISWYLQFKLSLQWRTTITSQLPLDIGAKFLEILDLLLPLKYSRSGGCNNFEKFRPFVFHSL